MVLIGNAVWDQGSFTESVPVCAEAHWSEESKQWVDSEEMSLLRFTDEQLIIHHWIDLPAQTSTT